MDRALVMIVFLAGVSSFQREVDAFHHHNEQQQQRRRTATGTTLSAHGWPSSQSSPCHICRDCMNTSYSYLCGRLQCQCLDSLEYCTLMVEEIQSDAITFVQLNATGRAFLGDTTLTGKMLYKHTLKIIHTFLYTHIRTIWLMLASGV